MRTIPMQTIAGISLPAGYPCLWHYYGTLAFYTAGDSPGSRSPDPDRAGKLDAIAEIRRVTGWPVYDPSAPPPPLADWRWADTEHARGVRAKLEVELLRVLEECNPVQVARLVALKHAVKLEVLGMRHSSGKRMRVVAAELLGMKKTTKADSVIGALVKEIDRRNKAYKAVTQEKQS